MKDQQVRKSIEGFAQAVAKNVGKVARTVGKVVRVLAVKLIRATNRLFVLFFVGLEERQVTFEGLSRSLSLSLGDRFPRKLSSYLTVGEKQITVADGHFVVFNPSILSLNNFAHERLHTGQPMVLFSATRNNRIMNHGRFSTSKLLGATGYQSELVNFISSASDCISASTRLRPDELIAWPMTRNSGDLEYADSRLFRTKYGIFLSLSVSSISGFADGSSNKVAIAGIHGDDLQIDALRLLDSPFGKRVEKNWMPISGSMEDDLRFIYRIVPTQTLFFDNSNSSKPTRVMQVEGPEALLEYRGGSALQKLPADSGYICVAHRTRFKPLRHYVHRFIHFKEYPNGLKVAAFSPAFCFLQPQDVEFSSGLEIVGERAIVSFGYRDEEAWIMDLDLEDLVDFTNRYTCL